MRTYDKVQWWHLISAVFHIQTLLPEIYLKSAINRNQPTNQQKSKGCGLAQHASMCPLVTMLTGTLTGISEQLAASNFRAEKKKLLIGIVALYNKQQVWQ